MGTTTPLYRSVGIVLCFLLALALSYGLWYEYHQLTELKANATLMPARVLRVDRPSPKEFVTVFRMTLPGGGYRDHADPMRSGDNWLPGDELTYYYHANQPDRSRPNTLGYMYGPILVLALFLAGVVMIILSLLLGQGSRFRSYPLRLLAFCWCLAVAAGCFYVANYQRAKTMRLLEAGVRTEATVVRIIHKTKSRSGRRSGSTTVHFPVYQLTDQEGNVREYTQNWSGKHGLDVGDTAPFIYHPGYHQLGRRDSFWLLHGLTLLFGFLGLAFIYSAFWNLGRRR